MMGILYSFTLTVQRCMAFSALLMTVAIGMVNPVMADSLIPEARVMDQGPVQLGNFQVYFSAFNSTFIPPGIAEQYNLRRSERFGIVNIAIRAMSPDGVGDDSGRAVTARVSGHTTNLLTQKNSLVFSEIREGSAIYYLADFKFADEELLRFAINVKPEGSSRGETLRFEQTFYQESIAR